PTASRRSSRPGPTPMAPATPSRPATPSPSRTRCPTGPRCRNPSRSPSPRSDRPRVAGRPGSAMIRDMFVSHRARLLVATPVLGDPNFDRTVVLMLEHTPEGAVGLVLNRPSGTDLDEAGADWEGWDLLAAQPPVVFVG